MSNQFLYDYLAGSCPPVQRNQAVIALLAWNLMADTQRLCVYNAFVSPANQYVNP